MNNITKAIIGATVGAAVGYTIYLTRNKRERRKLKYGMNRFAHKTKKQMKHMVEQGKHGVEHIKDQMHHQVEKGRKYAEANYCG